MILGWEAGAVGKTVCEGCGHPANACACPSLEEVIARDFAGLDSVPAFDDDEYWPWDFPQAS